MKNELIFSAEELQEFEALEIRGGRGVSDYPAQDECINEAFSCGAGITQKKCVNKVMGCGVVGHIGCTLDPNSKCPGQVNP